MSYERMENYKLSENAKSDLKRIYRRGIVEHGENQADKYYNTFFNRFEQIAEQPYLYQEVAHIRAGYRHSVCGADTIYYRICDDMVEIMNVLGQQDIDKLL